ARRGLARLRGGRAAVGPPEPQDGRGAEQDGVDAIEPLAQLAECSEWRARLGARDEDRDAMPERRVAEHLASLELPGEKPGDVVVDSVTERRGVGLEGLHDDAPGCVAPAAARELGDELERP